MWQFHLHIYISIQCALCNCLYTICHPSWSLQWDMSCQKPNGDSKILCRHLLFSPMAPFSHYQYKNTSTGCRRQTAQLIVRTGSYDPVLTFSSAPMMHWPFLLQSSLFSSICLYTTLHSIIISITYYQSLVLFHSVSCLPPITPNWTQLIADPGVGFLPIKSFFFFSYCHQVLALYWGVLLKGLYLTM